MIGQNIKYWTIQGGDHEDDGKFQHECLSSQKSRHAGRQVERWVSDETGRTADTKMEFRISDPDRGLVYDFGWGPILCVLRVFSR